MALLLRRLTQKTTRDVQENESHRTRKPFAVRLFKSTNSYAFNPDVRWRPPEAAFAVWPLAYVTKTTHVRVGANLVGDSTDTAHGSIHGGVACAIYMYNNIYMTSTLGERGCIRSNCISMIRSRSLCYIQIRALVFTFYHRRCRPNALQAGFSTYPC